ncbi:MAG: nuclear transport factor 2 family protein [Acidobacteria bacterium]|nr:nuclear transport factor 2 family protein [Acidobacteriota bacterium]
MRKVCVILVASLALAATCMGQSTPTSQPDSGRIKPPTATSTSTGVSATGDEAMLIAREKEVWELIKKKDAQGFAAYLAEDQLYINSQGAHSKAETVKGIAAEGPSDLTLDDWKVIMIDKDAAIVTYRATPKAEACGPEPAVERNSTVWVKRGGKWLAVFHQDTMLTSGK